MQVSQWRVGVSTSQLGVSMSANQKHDAWASRVAERKRRNQAVEENSLRKAALGLLTIFSAFSSVYTAIFLVSMFSDEDFTLKEILFCGMLFVAFFLGLRLIYRIGFIHLPAMSQAMRAKFLPIYGAVAALGIMIAASTSVFGVAADPVRQHHLQEISIETSTYAGQTVSTVKRVFAQDSMIEGKQREQVSAEQGETRGGTHCGSGRGGAGQCATLLRSLVLTTDNALTELRRAEASALPLIARIEAEAEQLRRTSRERNVSYGEKRERIQTHIAQLDLMTRQLQQLVPLGILETLASDWTRDYSTAGMSKQGQDRLTSMLSEPARVLAFTAQDAAHQFSLDPPELSTSSIVALVGMYADDMALLLVIAIFPDLLAGLIIIFNYITVDKPMDPDDPLSEAGAYALDAEDGSNPSVAGITPRIRAANGAATHT